MRAHAHERACVLYVFRLWASSSHESQRAPETTGLTVQHGYVNCTIMRRMTRFTGMDLGEMENFTNVRVCFERICMCVGEPVA